MSESAAESFTCAACGQQYRWKRELAGRKAKCKCGQTMTVPASAGRTAAAASAEANSAASGVGAPGSDSATSTPVARQAAPGASGAGSKPVPPATSVLQASPAQAAAAPTVPLAAAATVPPGTAAATPTGAKAGGDDDMYALAGEDRTTGAARSAKPATIAARVHGTTPTAPPKAASSPSTAVDEAGGDVEDDMYSLSDDGSPARPAQAPAHARPAAAAPAAAGVAPQPVGAGGVAGVVAAPQILGYVGTGKKEVQEEGPGSGLFRDLYLPIILVVSGILISVLHAVLAQDMALAHALPMVGILLFVDLVLMFLGCMAAIKMMDIAFGDPLQAILKMCAILIGPGALGTVAAFAVGGGFLGMAVAGAISLVLYYVMFMLFFDLDLSEVLLLSAILIMIRLWLGMLVGGLLVAAILGGEAAPTGIMMGMAGAGAVGAPGAASMGDERPALAEQTVLRTAEHFAKGSEPEARKWLAESPSNVIVGYERPGSAKFVEDLYALGAARVHVSRFTSGERAEAGLVGIVLPPGRKERATLFAWHEQYAQSRWIRGYLDDDGQPCIVVYMDDAMKAPDDEASKLDEDPVLLRDAAAEERLEGKSGKADPTTWTPNGDRKLVGISRARSIQIVRDLQQLGAVSVTATGNVVDREEGSSAGMNAYTTLVVRLPTQPGARKALFNWYAEYATRHPGQEFMEDHGQKYIMLEAGPESATPVTPRTLAAPQSGGAAAEEEEEEEEGEE